MTFIFSSTYVFFVAVVTFSIYNISPIDCFSLRVTPHSRTKTSLHIFGKFAEAFSNDSFDKKENAGLTNVKAIVGQKISAVAAQARAKISYNCKQGDCGTCMIKINGRSVKACQMVVPKGKCSINTSSFGRI